jgi:hypothetical protein
VAKIPAPFVCLAFVLTGFGSGQLHAQDPSLIAVNISFNLPKCDDKDDDSSVNVAIVQGGTVVADANRLGFGKTWSDPGSSGSMPLVLKKAITKSEYAGTTTKFHFNTVGNDTMCAGVTVEALFADNSKVTTTGCQTFKVSESNRDASFKNEACP